MAQPWTMVAWALGPRDRTTLPPQRRAAWSADCVAARCPLEIARARAMAAGHRAPPKGGSAGEGSPVPLPGQTTAARTEQGAVLAPQELSTEAGENGALGQAHCCHQWGFGRVPAGEAPRSEERGEASVEGEPPTVRWPWRRLSLRCKEKM
jgi:hypothetical protein